MRRAFLEREGLNDSFDEFIITYLYLQVLLLSNVMVRGGLLLVKPVRAFPVGDSRVIIHVLGHRTRYLYVNDWLYISKARILTHMDSHEKLLSSVQHM